MTHRALRHEFVIDTDRDWLTRFLGEALVHLRTDDVRGPATEYAASYDDTGPIPLIAVSIAGRETAPAEPTPAIARFLTAVNVAAVASVAEHPVLHASGASVGGRCIVVPGRPGQGKSTLAAGLVGEGCGYVTDEAIPIDDAGQALPYPKPIVVGRGSWRPLAHVEGARVRCDALELDAWHLDPARIGATVEHDPLPVGAVVVPRYRPGGPTALQPISPAEATAAMCSNTFNLHDHGSRGVTRIAEVAKTARCLELVHDDLREACRLLLDVLEG